MVSGRLSVRFRFMFSAARQCPEQRMTASEAMARGFFTEKPVPEWHAWHWAMASAEIPRGNKKGHEDEAMGVAQVLWEDFPWFSVIF